MSIELLPASLNPVDPPQASDVSTSLVPLTQSAVSTRAGQISLVPSTDTVAWSSSAWSSSTRPGGANRIDATPVEDSEDGGTTDATGPSDAEYVSGWAGSRSIESTAIAHYLFYAGAPGGWSGQLINVYV
jgi:hypothetical protein